MRLPRFGASAMDDKPALTLQPAISRKTVSKTVIATLSPAEFTRS